MWNRLDKFANHSITRLTFAVLYIAFYIFFAPNYWWFLLLPLHFAMGPVQGAIVNWFGHKFGYRNFDNGDHSKNTTPWGFVMMGELFQNNHHKYKESANFAQRWFEFDTTFLVMKALHYIGIIKLKPYVRNPPVTIHLPSTVLAPTRLLSDGNSHSNLRNDHISR